MDPDTRIFVAGHRGLVGSAIVRHLEGLGCRHVLTASRDELDLRDQTAVAHWMSEHRPQQVYLVAGTVGGILANSTRPAEFIYDNLMIHATVIHAAHEVGVEKLLYLGSSCIYPRETPQPIPESALLTGVLEPTNEPYAVAKIAGIKMCESYRRQYGSPFITAMPTNLYGPGDNFDEQSGHVLPSLMQRFHTAKLEGVDRVGVWGSGTPRREFLHVDDLAEACVFVMDRYNGLGHINIGTGEDIPIRALAEQIRDIVHPGAEIEWDATKPDGTPRKLLDVSLLRSLGWRHTIGLADGIESTYRWYLEQHADPLHDVTDRAHL